ncbi:MAG: TatD family hydrolase [Candidatus Babeliales bacterium]|jgi:TatD DNase family protein
MLIDTHCHLNMMVKQKFDAPLTEKDLSAIKEILKVAATQQVNQIVNVGTSLVESQNCLMIAKKYPAVFATVGIHPNDCTSTWRKDVATIAKWVREKKENKIVGIGECGIDRHYEGHNLPRQYDAFKAQVDLAMENDLALVIHSRDAYDETLKILDTYKDDLQRVVMHCFSYDWPFAQTVIAWNFALGIGGTITYPKNEELRTIVSQVDLRHIVLETDAPFLPPQAIRGQQNHPQNIKEIATFIANLRNQEFDVIAKETTKTAQALFKINN